MQALPKDLASKLPISAEAKKKKYSPAKIACFRKCMKKVGKKAQKECLAKCSKKKDTKDTKKTENVDTKKTEARKKDGAKAPPERRKGGGGGGGGGRGRREAPLRQAPQQQQVAQPQMMRQPPLISPYAKPVWERKKQRAVNEKVIQELKDPHHIGPRPGESNDEYFNAKYDKVKKERDQYAERMEKGNPDEVKRLNDYDEQLDNIRKMQGKFAENDDKKIAEVDAKRQKLALSAPNVIRDPETGNIINTVTGDMMDPLARRVLRIGPPAPPTVETPYEKEVREGQAMASTEQEMENVDPQFVPLEGMDTSAPVPAPATPAQTFDFFGRERATPAREPRRAPTLGEMANTRQDRLVAMGEDLGISTRDMTSFLKGAEQREKQAIQAGKQDALRNAQKDAVQSKNVTTGEMQARKQARDAKRDARQKRRDDASNIQELMRRSTQALPPVPAPQPTYNDTALSAEEEAIEREDMGAEDVRLPAPAPEPEPARRKRIMGKNVQAKVDAIEKKPVQEEEEKEEREDLQESKVDDVADVQLPMPAVRQEYGQRATLRIAGARGSFDKLFQRYDRVPLESKYPALAGTKEFIRKTPYGPFAPVKKSILDSLPAKRTDIDFSKHRLEKRARATLALLEDTQPRQRARNINTNITPQQVSSVQSRMQQYRQVTRGLNEAEVFRGTNRVERYSTQPAITVSAEPVAPAETVATVELDEGGDEL